MSRGSPERPPIQGQGYQPHAMQPMVWMPMVATPGTHMSQTPSVMYVMSSPGLPVPMQTPHPHGMLTPQQFSSMPSSTPHVPKPSFHRQSTSSAKHCQDESNDKVSPFVQQPVTSPFANTATLLQISNEKLHRSNEATPEPNGNTMTGQKFHFDALDATWGTNDGDLMFTRGSANSLEDVLDAKEIASIVQATQREGNAEGLKILEKLRNEKTDVAVRNEIMSLSEDVCVSLVCTLETSPQMMLDLCLNERGKIIANLIEKLPSDCTFPLVKFALDNFLTLALSQSGCIALPRILSNITDSQRDVFFSETKKELSTLITHAFGNYVVKHFVQMRVQKYNADVCVYLCSADSLRIVSTNKFGSHVLEDVIKHSTREELRPLIEYAFGNMDLLRHMCHNQFANYCIQSMFRFMDTCDRDPVFYSHCVNQVSVACQGSKFSKNIMKRASSIFKMPGEKKQKGRPANNSVQQQKI